MHIASLRLELRIEGCPSARRRRQVLAEMAEHLRRHFNVAAAEDDRPASPEAGVLLVATVGRGRREARETLRRVAEAVGVHPLALLTGQQIFDH